MITAIEEAIADGLTVETACQTVGVSERRLREWRARARQGDFTRHPKSKDVRPFNALTPTECETIAQAVACREWADLSCREISVKIMEQSGLYVSPVAVWEHEKRLGIAGHRGKRRLSGRHRGDPPDTSFVNGPNQLWSWDITKLRSGIPHVSWYLATVLDQWSRKVVGWAISDCENSDLVQRAWDTALLAEGVLDSPASIPTSLSDRGSQMRSRSTAQFFKDLGIDRLFARPRTPNDNAFAESLYATIKMHPDYPEFFGSVEDAEKYFRRFFHWYNGDHLHTRIGMVTPCQKHSGEWVKILEQREVIKQKTFAMRRAFNMGLKSQNKEMEAAVS